MEKQIKKKIDVFVFGNRDLKFDSLPVRILPKLKKVLPNLNFQIKDPNEELGDKESFIIIDTAEGIKEAKVFNDLKSFLPSPRFSLHDFDVYANLRLLEKLKKLPKYKIIALPLSYSENEAQKKVFELIVAILTI